MNFVVKILNLTLSAIILNGLLRVEAQSGTSVILGSKHYYIETTSTAGFYEASDNCAQLSMTLASIETKAEYDKLKSFLQINDLMAKEYWLGANSYGSTTPVWLGTGKPISYWPSAELTTADKCVKTDNSFAYVDTSACTDAHYYICEKPVEPACGKYGQCRYSFSSYSS